MDELQRLRNELALRDATIAACATTTMAQTKAP